MRCSISLFCLLFIGHLANEAQGAIWTRSRSVSRQGGTDLEATTSMDELTTGLDSLDGWISPAERESIFRSLSNLDSFNHKSDCFKDMAGKLKAQCNDDMTEAARVEAAICFTLCELSTARMHSIPLECKAYTYQEAAVLSDDATRSDCVEALSRSTQHWSSYSGYLREIPQLCFAYRRWNDIDAAKSLYHNATLEKIALLKVLQEREVIALQRDAVRQENWDQSFLTLATVVDQITVAKTDLERGSDANAARFNDIALRVVESWDELAIKANNALSDLVEDIRLGITNSLRSTSLDIVSSARGALESSVEQHNIRFSSALVTRIESDLEQAFSALFEGIAVRSDNAIASLHALETVSTGLGRQLDHATEMTRSLVVTADYLSAYMEQATGVLLSHHMVLNATLDSASLLSSQIGLLAAQAEDHFHAINATAHSVQTSLGRRHGPDWGASVLRWTMHSLSRLNPLFWQYLTNEPLFKAFWIVVQLVWHAVWLFLSTGASWILLWSRRSRMKDGTAREAPEDPGPTILASTPSNTAHQESYGPDGNYAYPSRPHTLLWNRDRGSAQPVPRPRAARVPRISPRLTERPSGRSV